MPIYVNGTIRLGGTVEATPAEGDLWYDSGKFNFGTSQNFPSAWSAGGNLGTARRLLAGAGTQAAGLCMGGTTGALSDDTEEYNGTSWSGGGDLITERQALGGCGTQSAGLCMGGTPGVNGQEYNVTEEYNGSAWSTGGNILTAREGLAACGSQSA